MRDAITTCKYVRSLSSYGLVSEANQDIIIRVPGEAGRLLVQLYFQAEHANTAVTHPEDDTPITPSGPIKKPKKPAPRKKPQPRAQIPLRGAFPGRPPYYGPQPTYGPFNGLVEPSHLRQQPQYNLAPGVAPRPYGQAFGAFPTHRYLNGAPFFRF